jgi:oxygen-independent coproporphyrinogen-3 oxidase
VSQYEISNFSRPGFESRHNLKYWTRQPYLGFGVDAHSMLLSTPDNAVRLATADALEKYVSGSPLQRTLVSNDAALEETFFLGLRLNRGVDLARITEQFGQAALVPLQPIIADLEKQELLERSENAIRLTKRGRLLSNEVFQHFLTPEPRSLTPALVTPSV